MENEGTFTLTPIGSELGMAQIEIDASTLEIELIAQTVWDIAKISRVYGDAASEAPIGSLTVLLYGRSYTTQKFSLIYVGSSEYLLITIVDSEVCDYYFIIQRNQDTDQTNTFWSTPEGANLIRLDTDEDLGGEPFFRLSDSEKLKMLLG